MGNIEQDAVRIRGYSPDSDTYKFAKYDISSPKFIVGDWKFVSIDLYETLQKEFDTEGAHYLVYRIFFESSPVNGGVWIDEVYISDDEPKSESRNMQF